MSKSSSSSVNDADYVALASFRHEIRKFLAFSEARAGDVGLTPQQHQALLAIRAAQPEQATVGYVADRLILKPHSASGLLDRLEMLGLIMRQVAQDDRRRSLLLLTDKARDLLHALSTAHRDEIRRLRPMLTDIFEMLG
ncbi:MarR family winged helix-turn-helix transcriptional regulator [Novosphingobium sp. KN65.2]|uniref:MarR family winged helix-turn-helix transcriptional regulator n=1 Tax=Novosphingobium sp. KN65.2 TaxID=1478134 RepID=UPI0005E68EC1|nr:MarR family transcriptional regulator [Novosphingobium sp. KN65.2]CDO38901.1 Transcriptional regulator, MarR family [Novosphingobium sp. KN65.2]